MDVRKLRYFAQIVEAQSMSAAAKRLHVAQPALSKAIRSLEDDLGTLLLQRSPHGIAMTEAGERLYEHCQIIFGQIDRARHAVRSSVAKPSGQVAIGMPYSVMTVLGLPLLKTVSQAYPGLCMELVQDHSHLLTSRLRSGRLDLAVMAAPRSGAGLVSSALMLEDLLFVEKSAGARPVSSPISFPEAAGRAFILPGLSNGLRAAAEAYFRTRSLRLTIAHEVDGIALITRCVEAGLGVTLMPGGCIACDPAAPHLDVRPLEGGCVRTIVLCRADTIAPTSAALQTADLLRSIATDLAASGAWPGRRLVDVEFATFR